MAKQNFFIKSNIEGYLTMRYLHFQHISGISLLYDELVLDL